MARSSLFLIISTTLFSVALCEEVYTPPPDRSDIGVPCAKNDHFTDPKFTCCASQRYDAPPIYTNMDSSCWSAGNNLDKLVKKAWEVFKCFMGNKPVTFNDVADILSVKLPNNVRAGIKEYLKTNFTGYAPYTGIPELEGYESYANAWNAYYLAENWACSDAGTKGRQRVDLAEDSHRCYNWVDQGTRRGDCCKEISIPFQLIPDPIVDRYYALKNWTATHLLTLVAADYNWQNTTIVMYSDNVAICLRTAMFIQQGLITEAGLKKEIEARTPPNYKAIADALIPKWMDPQARLKIREVVANETALNMDSDIQAIQDYSTSLYQFVYADEWKRGRYNENSTRFLFWNCRAHNLIMRRYKDFPISELC